MKKLYMKDTPGDFNLGMGANNSDSAFDMPSGQDECQRCWIRLDQPSPDCRLRLMHKQDDFTAAN